MTRRQILLATWDRHRSVAPAVAMGLVVMSLAIYPAPLGPLVRAYQALCEQYPVLTLLTFNAPPASVALLLGIASLGIVVGAGAGIIALLQTHRFNQQLRRSASPMPPRLARLAAELGIVDRITYLPWGHPAACCYGFGRPDIAITAGLATQLDDAELLAVLAHERQHLRRRDPVRYLVLYALSIAAFVFPVAAALRQRRETRIELAADRAALAVAPRGALAGALLVALNAPRIPAPGAAGLTPTEARIAHLGGRAVMPDVPTRLVVASLGLVMAIMAAVAHLTVSGTTARAVDMVCEFCTHIVLRR